MQFLLDTSACIVAMRNHPDVVKRMSAATPGDCAISTITSYELHTGIAKCAAPSKERAKVDLLLKTVIELPCDARAAREAGRIRSLRERYGQMIGSYDVLLAAQAVAAGLTLVTDNTAEFPGVAGLAVENWQDG